MKTLLKSTLLAVVFSALSVLSAWAGFSDFKNLVTNDDLKPFARDIGGMLGANPAHSGRSLGFPGFDVGIKAGGMLKVDKDDNLLKAADLKKFGMPWIQAELGLPFKLDGFIRGFSYGGLTMVGGGLRYGLLNVTDLPLTPQLTATVMANTLSYSQFSATHIGGDLTVSVKALIVEPYLGVGVDRTKVEVKSVGLGNVSGVKDGDTAVGTAPRITLGLNLKPLPLVYIHAGYTLIKSASGFETGVGIRF